MKQVAAAVAVLCAACGSSGNTTTDPPTATDASTPSTAVELEPTMDAPQELDRVTTVEVERCRLRLDDYASTVRLFASSNIDPGEAMLMDEALEHAREACETATLTLATDPAVLEAGGVERNQVRIASEGVLLTLDVQSLTLLGILAGIASAEQTDTSRWYSDLQGSKEQLRDAISLLSE